MLKTACRFAFQPLLGCLLIAGCCSCDSASQLAMANDVASLTERATAWSQLLSALPTGSEENDIVLIADYLQPGMTSTSRAREIYASWTGPDTAIRTTGSNILDVTVSDDHVHGAVAYVITYATAQGEIGTAREDTQWIKIDGTWYRTIDPASLTILTSTSTPSATTTPAPRPTPSPSPTSTPVPDSTTYSGSGDDVISIVKPGNPDDPVLAYIRGNREARHFAVKGIDERGGGTDLLVNTTEPYEGIVGLDFTGTATSVRLEISATGSWQIELRSLRAARRVQSPGVARGAGDDVFLVTGETDTAHIVGNSESRYFGVWAWGDSRDLLVNTTEPYKGRTLLPPSTFLVEVRAEGDWTITFE